MPNYKLQKKGRSARRVEVRAQHIDIHILPLLICALVAFVIWLYIAATNAEALHEQNGEGENTEQTSVTTVVEDYAL